MRRLIAVACFAFGLWACAPSPATTTSAPPSSPAEVATCTEDCPTASDTSGAFRLELVLPRVEWKSDEPLTGTVTLSYDGPNRTKIYGSAGLLNFRYAEVGGPHKVEPVSTAECGSYDADPATPMSKPLSKSGAFSDDDPDVAFLRSFLTAPDVRLPAGTWDVTALAQFTEGGMCGAGGHSMAATVRVTVSD
jgi:hypothetical protein